MPEIFLIYFLVLLVIKDDFRQEPVNTTIPMSALAKLYCKPPSGKPEPEVIWLHNGKAVVPSDRIQVQENGDLIINSVTTQDGGEYVCVAQNRAGRKLSSSAVLKVLGNECHCCLNTEEYMECIFRVL